MACYFKPVQQFTDHLTLFNKETSKPLKKKYLTSKPLPTNVPKNTEKFPQPQKRSTSELILGYS